MATITTEHGSTTMSYAEIESARTAAAPAGYYKQQAWVEHGRLVVEENDWLSARVSSGHDRSNEGVTLQRCGGGRRIIRKRIGGE